MRHAGRVPGVFKSMAKLCLQRDLIFNLLFVQYTKGEILLA